VNIEHARSFLAVADTGSFVAAAERLHVTQSTISARIRTLEDTLGTTLFVRNKAGAVPTPSGVRFRAHAIKMVRAFERARREIRLPDNISYQIAIGARFGLWDDKIIDWIARQRRERSDLSVHAEIAFEPELMQGLIDGHLDIGIMYTPQRRPNLEQIPFKTEHLKLISSCHDESEISDSYIHIDWAPEFDEQISSSLPAISSPRISVNVGWLGLEFLKVVGGSAYLPERLAEVQLASGKFHIVKDAPEFDIRSWLVIRDDRDKKIVDPMVESLIMIQSY